jgi:TonB family protein
MNRSARSQLGRFSLGPSRAPGYPGRSAAKRSSFIGEEGNRSVMHAARKLTSTALILAVVSLAANVATGASKAARGRRNLESLVVERVAPPWPPEPGMHVAGDVVMRVTLDSSGKLTSARAVSGHPLKRTAALSAVRRWTFRPMLKGARPRAVTGYVTVHFPSD